MKSDSAGHIGIGCHLVARLAHYSLDDNYYHDLNGTDL